MDVGGNSLESDLEGYEYVKGELVPLPPYINAEHGDISMNLISPLKHVRSRKSVRTCFMPQTQVFQGWRTSVLMPDIAFVSQQDRLPH